MTDLEKHTSNAAKFARDIANIDRSIVRLQEEISALSPEEMQRKDFLERNISRLTESRAFAVSKVSDALSAASELINND